MRRSSWRAADCGMAWATSLRGTFPRAMLADMAPPTWFFVSSAAIESIYRSSIIVRLRRIEGLPGSGLLPRRNETTGHRQDAAPSLQSNNGVRSPNARRGRRRGKPGHGKQTMCFARCGQGLLVNERQNPLQHRSATRSIESKRLASPHAGTSLVNSAKLPKAIRQNSSVDNGNEFAEHHRLTKPRSTNVLLRSLVLAKRRRGKLHRALRPLADRQKTELKLITAAALSGTRQLA